MGKGAIGSKLDRIKLVNDVLKVDISEYVPPHLTDDHLIKDWLNTNSSFDKNPSKWKLPLLAQAICDFDVILQRYRADVAISNDSLPQP